MPFHNVANTEQLLTICCRLNILDVDCRHNKYAAELFHKIETLATPVHLANKHFLSICVLSELWGTPVHAFFLEYRFKAAAGGTLIVVPGFSWTPLNSIQQYASDILWGNIQCRKTRYEETVIINWFQNTNYLHFSSSLKHNQTGTDITDNYQIHHAENFNLQNCILSQYMRSGLFKHHPV